jgi:hypothetical protein
VILAGGATLLAVAMIWLRDRRQPLRCPRCRRHVAPTDLSCPECGLLLVGAFGPPRWGPPRGRLFGPADARAVGDGSGPVDRGPAEIDVRQGPARRWIAALVLAVLGGGALLLSVRIASVPERDRALPGPESVTLRGGAGAESEPFRLVGGVYALEWQADATQADTGCTNRLLLVAADGSPVGDAFALAFPARGSWAGGDDHRPIAPGEYRLRSFGDCDWTVDITRDG